jgi:manganese/zinc/iron transport system permease protein
MAYYNPYEGKTFFAFFLELMVRLWLFVTGGLSVGDVASDEIQLIVLMGVAASSALVGVFLVLRKMTMLANSLSHTLLLGIVAVYLLTTYGVGGQEKLGLGHAPLSLHLLLMAAVVTGLFTVFLTNFLTQLVRLQEDASIGLIFTSLFALGIILVTLLSRNAHIGTEIVMGNVDSLQPADCRLVLWILAINVVLFALFFKEFQITTFDAGLAGSLGISAGMFNYLLMAQASCTVIGAFRSVGVIMVLALLTGPPLMARLLTHSLKRMVVLSMAIGCIASLLGVALSRHLLTAYELALSTSGIVVCLIMLLFLTTLMAKQLAQSGEQKKTHH